MYAIIKTGSKQYKVKEGDVIDVELLGGDSKEVQFKDIVLLNSGNAIKMGASSLAGALVKGEVLGVVKDKKLIVYKYKRRKNCRRTNGHRQKLSRVRITAVAAEGK